MTKIYLDHAATTPIDPVVALSMLPYLFGSFGNPSSMYEAGRSAKAKLEACREEVARVLHAKSEEIIFTGSGTEANNLCVLGIARANRKFGNHILVSSIEHKSVLESAHKLAGEGFEVEFIPVDKFGMIDVAWVLSHITDRTILISVMYANNEIGTIEPIQALAEVVRARRGDSSLPAIHTDACQAAGALSLNVKKLGVDALTLNAGKIYGPKGVGALYVDKALAIEPVIFGGGQERGIRNGTESLMLIAGMSAALLRSEARRMEESKRLKALREYAVKEIKAAIPGVVFNGHPVRRLPNNIHISVRFVEGESMVLMLDEAGIAVSTGSACSSNDLQASHVLIAINQDEELRHGSLRITLGKDTAKRHINLFVRELRACVMRLRSLSPLLTITS